MQHGATAPTQGGLHSDEAQASDVGAHTLGSNVQACHAHCRNPLTLHATKQSCRNQPGILSYASGRLACVLRRYKRCVTDAISKMVARLAFVGLR